MPIVDDVLLGLQIQIDSLWYNLLLSLASIHWSVLRALVMMGYTIELLNDWLVDHAFAPLIAQTNASLQVAVSAAFVIALLVLGITYLLASFARLRVVDPRSAIAWYLAGALFFSLGTSLYQELNTFRRDVSQALYTSTLSGLQSSTGDTFASLNQVSSTDLGLIPLCDNLGTYMPDAATTTVDGLDVALAYLRADGIDVMGYFPPWRDLHCQPHPPDPQTGQWTAGNIPWEWRRPGSFFDSLRDPVFFSAMTAEERAASINLGSAAQGRLLTAWPLVLFGVAEQLVYLLLTIAQGLTFLSFGIAILFAFFKRTEVIARSIVDLWIELVVQTLVIALVQSLVVTFFLAGTASGSGIVVLGIGLICAVFMVIVLWSGVKAVWNSFNRLFSAMGQATGGGIPSPASGATLATSIAASAVGLGAGALAGMTALRQGATPAQAAGLLLGDYQPLSSAARSLMYLPGIRGTSLGEAAEQFTEGSATRRVAGDLPLVGRVAGPHVGARLLSNRDPDAVSHDDSGHFVSRPMLVPAVAEALSSWTTPMGKRRQPPATDSPDYIEVENGDLIPTALSQPIVRMGSFTPVGSPTPKPEIEQVDIARQRSDYHAEMVGEEMEQHISEVVRSSPSNTTQEPATSRLEGAAAQLERSAETFERAIFGQLKVTGVDNVASIMGDVVRQVASERVTQGQPVNMGIDYLTAAGVLAKVMGLTPAAGDKPPVRDDLARLGLFADTALRLGLSGQQAEQLAREVKLSPERTLAQETKAILTDQMAAHGIPPNEAEAEISRLETVARLLPNAVIAYGTLTLPIPHVQVEPNVDVQVNMDSEHLKETDQRIQKGEIADRE